MPGAKFSELHQNIARKNQEGDEDREKKPVERSSAISQTFGHPTTILEVTMSSLVRSSEDVKDLIVTFGSVTDMSLKCLEVIYNSELKLDK